MNAPALVLRDVAKRFGAGSALAGLSATVEGGHVVALAGPSGAGKTTLIRLIAGLLRPDAGSIEVMGQDTVAAAAAAQARLGYVPQSSGVYDRLSLRENLAVHAGMRNLAGAAERQRCDEVLRITGLAVHADRRAGTLGAAERQFLGLACALVGRPGLLLLDEPGAVLDPQARRSLFAVVQALAREGMTAVWSTANFAEAERCDAVLMLNAGRAVAHGRPAEIAAGFAGQVHALACGGGERRAVARRLRSLPAIREIEIRSAVLRITTDAAPDADAIRSLVPEARMERVAAGLEDCFLAALPPAAPDCLQTSEAEYRHPNDPLPRPPQGGEGGGEGGRAAPRPSSSMAAGAVLQPGEHARRLGGGDARLTLPSPPCGGRGNESLGSFILSGVPDTLILARNLGKRIGRSMAVERLDLAVAGGAVVGLVGPSGAGKTTILRLLCGLLSPSQGEARIAGIDPRRAPAALRARIGYMGQGTTLHGELTVAANLRSLAAAYGLDRRRRQARIAALAGAFALGPILDRPAAALTVPQRQRAAFAATLLHEPAVVLLDEPFFGVDPRTRRELWQQIDALAAGGAAILLATRMAAEGEACDRVLLIEHGRVLAEGAPDALCLGGAAGSLEDACAALLARRVPEQAA